MLYLIRHGEEDQTVRGGWSHSPLTNKKDLASVLKNVIKIVRE